MFAILFPAFGAFIVFSILRNIYARYAEARMARKLGCKPVPEYYLHWYDPLGFLQIRRAIKADKEYRFPNMLEDRYHEMSTMNGRDVSTFKQSILGSYLFFTTDPVNVQAILAKQFNDFSLGSARRGNFLPLLGDGIFTQDGKPWTHSRAMLRPSFARERVSDLELEDRHNQVMLRALPTDASGWTPVTDLQVLFFRLTLDTSTEFLFGESVNSQAAALPGYVASTNLPDDQREEVFAMAFDRGQATLALRARFNELYWLCNPRDFKKFCEQCHGFIDRYVRLALSHELREKSASDDDKGKYVFLEELAQQTRDPIELRSQLLNVLLAGRDTTASLLGWLFHSLAQHPAVWAKLREAVIADFGTAEHPKDISFASLKNCQYLQHCLNEALRLYPVVPVNSRRSVKDTTLPRGGGPTGDDPVFIPKGTEVNYSVFVMQRREALWGANAAEFNPERWAGRRAGWEYLPFNGGPRICLGQQFALTSAGYATVTLLRNFDRIELAAPAPAVLPHNLTLTSCPAYGVKVRLHSATKAS